MPDQDVARRVVAAPVAAGLRLVSTIEPQRLGADRNPLALSLALFTRSNANEVGELRAERIQPSLWHTWGGAPTTAALRHRGASNPVLLARQHERIAALMGQALPTVEDEHADPAAADLAY